MDSLANWVGRIVKIPSVSPGYTSEQESVTGEGRLARQLVEWFESFGGEVRTQMVLPGRSNVYGIWYGKSGRWVAVDVHMDTAPVSQMTGDPFSGRIQNGRVYGRGAVDCKATLGVILAMLEAMEQTSTIPDANLLISCTVDEEVGARGAPAFADWVRKRGLQIDQLVVAEPTMCAPGYGHKAAVRLAFRVEGVSTHACQPELGKNAITAAAHLILALQEEHQRLTGGPPETPLGLPTLAVTMVQGGRGPNVVPDKCTVSVDRRVVTGEKACDVISDLIKLAHRKCPLPVAVDVLQEMEAFFQSPDSAWVRKLAEWSAMNPAVIPCGTNSFAYGGLARECVVLGPGSIEQAHGAEEWVEVSQLQKLADIYQRWWGIDLQAAAL